MEDKLISTKKLESSMEKGWGKSLKEHRQLFEQEIDRAINNFNLKELENIYWGFLGALKIELLLSKDGMLSVEKIVTCYLSGVESVNDFKERNK